MNHEQTPSFAQTLLVSQGPDQFASANHQVRQTLAWLRVWQKPCNQLTACPSRLQAPDRQFGSSLSRTIRPARFLTFGGEIGILLCSLAESF